jgi:hypothetical protein
VEYVSKKSEQEMLTRRIGYNPVTLFVLFGTLSGIVCILTFKKSPGFRSLELNQLDAHYPHSKHQSETTRRHLARLRDKKSRTFSQQLSLCNADYSLVTSGLCPQVSYSYFEWCPGAMVNGSVASCPCSSSYQYYFWSENIGCLPGEPGNSQPAKPENANYFYYAPNVEFFHLPENADQDKEDKEEKKHEDQEEIPEEEKPDSPKPPSPPPAPAPPSPPSPVPPPPPAQHFPPFWSKPFGKYSWDANGDPIAPVIRRIPPAQGMGCNV